MAGRRTGAGVEKIRDVRAVHFTQHKHSVSVAPYVYTYRYHSTAAFDYYNLHSLDVNYENLYTAFCRGVNDNGAESAFNFNGRIYNVLYKCFIIGRAAQKLMAALEQGLQAAECNL